MNYKEKLFDIYEEISKKRNETQRIASEVVFIVEIDNPKLRYYDYKKRIYFALTEKAIDIDYDFSERNLIESFIREKVTYVSKYKRLYLVVTDFSLKEGSFIITFSLFAFTTAMNYGQFRESLDYLKDDLTTFFKDVFSDETNTTVLTDYKDRPNHLLEDINHDVFPQIVKTISREFRRMKMIIMLIGSVALVFSFYAVYKIEAQPPQPTIDNATVQTIVRTEIDKVNSEKTNEELTRLLKQQLEQSKSNKAKEIK